MLVLVALPTVGAEPAGRQESWDAVYMAGSKVGHLHTWVEPVKDRGRDLLRVRYTMKLNLRRLKDQVAIEQEYGTIETLDGTVLKLDTRTLASRQVIRTFGEVVDGQMTLTMEGSGQEQKVTIPWGPDVRGPYAVEQSLSRAPIKPGEVRDLRMYVPDLNKVCDIKLTAKATEDVQLGGGVRRTLLRIEQTTRLEGKPRPEFDLTLWADSGGQVLKSESDVMGGMVLYRTTREGAERPDVAVKLDQIRASIVRITHKIPSPESKRAIIYKVSLKSEDPAQVFPADRRQTFRPGPVTNSAILEVKTAGPNDGAPGPEGIDDQYLRPNVMVTSKDPAVVSFARKAVGNATDPWEKVGRIVHWVAQNIKDKNFETTFAPASEVARDLSGDCTEHGVLTAAMCRAVGVPARVVVGLVYADHLGGFGFHLWNEVYVNRRWVAVDSAFDQTSVDAVHIKVSETSLDGVSPYEAFLPVVRVVSKLSLEPQEIH
jgi:transglutaminase-like putative cysteine protease